MKNSTKIVLSIVAGVALAYIVKKYFDVQEQKKYQFKILDALKDCNGTCENVNGKCLARCDTLGPIRSKLCKIKCKGVNLVCTTACAAASKIKK